MYRAVTSEDCLDRRGSVDVGSRVLESDRAAFECLPLTHLVV